MAKVAQQKKTIAQQMKDAQFATLATFRAGDDEKWAVYQQRDPDGQIAWRKAEGHAEFCRLQRLHFHGVFVRPLA